GAGFSFGPDEEVPFALAAVAAYSIPGRKSWRGVVPHSLVEEHGPIRTTVCSRVEFLNPNDYRILVRRSYFAGTMIARLTITLQNPNRAKHQGGLWDLGDPKSVLLDTFGLALQVHHRQCYVVWRLAPDHPMETVYPTNPGPGGVSLLQVSSG